jgi:hypothetical protein
VAAADVLGEWFGYVISGRTDLHKIFLNVGPTRGGKGVIARIETALIGKHIRLRTDGDEGAEQAEQELPLGEPHNGPVPRTTRTRTTARPAGGPSGPRDKAIVEPTNDSPDNPAREGEAATYDGPSDGDGAARRPKIEGGYELIGVEPPDTACRQCGQGAGAGAGAEVYLIRDPFKGVGSEPLHEACAKAWFEPGLSARRVSELASLGRDLAEQLRDGIDLDQEKLADELRAVLREEVLPEFVETELQRVMIELFR